MKKLHTILLAALAFTASTLHAELAVKSGETIAFMGDSITQAGNKKGGYVDLVISALKNHGLDVKRIPAGKSGSSPPTCSPGWMRMGWSR